MRSALVIGGGVLLILSLVHLKQSAVVFDAPFAQLAGIKLNIIRAMGFIALVATTVIGVKVVGVVLMVAVVIAPAIAASMDQPSDSFHCVRQPHRWTFCCDWFLSFHRRR